MGRIKCEYCGSFIDDSLANCPHCGAVNQHMVRYASKTPKTIEELKSWYTARNLPPESVTRFFIGKNVMEPRAFGIYQENSKFIVYKNKSDGTRAIRYAGNDEVYAVNEIYMKLKEEILNQKNRNLSAGNTASQNGQAFGNVYRISGRAQKKRSFRPVRIIIILMILSVLVNLAAEKERVSSGYYANGDRNSIYYFYNGEDTEWWRYDPDADDWLLTDGAASGEDYPEGITEENLADYDTVCESLGRVFTDFKSSRPYYDHHHPAINQGYYQTDNSLYYYLRNIYGSGSGWYLYDDGWNYLGDDDLDSVGDDVWYHTEDYYSGNSYDMLDSDRSYYFSDLESWNADFEDTSYYEQYESDYDAYQSTYSATSSYDDDSWDDDSWDNDSSWDWDSGDSWDSGGSDWDSDW